jgi:tRNA(adenine34) deaminase
MKSTLFGPEKDHFFMHKALKLAHKAYSLDEVPIGAIAVDCQGTIIGRGYNLVEKKHTQRAHAEVIALEQAAKKKKDWRLEGCWLYVTLEPCTMCMGLIQLSRLQGVVYAASSPLFGYLDSSTTSFVYRKDTPIIIAGVGAQESAQLLRLFFKEKRKKDEYD